MVYLQEVISDNIRNCIQLDRVRKYSFGDLGRRLALRRGGMFERSLRGYGEFSAALPAGSGAAARSPIGMLDGSS